MNIVLMQKGGSKDEFPHWSETLSALTYASQDENNLVEFCHYKRIKPEDLYIDPLGKVHECFTQGSFDKNTPLVVNGSIHLETSPMSYGIIPYNKFRYKVAIEHTTGYSPWDYLQMVDLANISRDNPKNAGNCKLRFLMNERFYKRFMKVDWKGIGYLDYDEYKGILAKSLDDGFVNLESYEVTQFWLEKVPTSPSVVESDHICLVLNWANFKKASYVQKIVDLCKQLHDYTGLDIDVKLHSYCKESFLKYFTAYDFIHIMPYLNVSKYDIMDTYKIFFVDNTGFGYETSYRNKFKNREVDIFYVSGLPAEENEFRGTRYMNVSPKVDQNGFFYGVHHSNFDPELIEETFPHRCSTDEIPNEVRSIIVRNCEELKKMFP